MKGSAVVETMTPKMLRQYAELCGTALARAHARSGDRIAVAGYLGKADTFDRAVADFALHYADQTALDHALLTAAISDGDIAATHGI
jgi:thiamine monophosphate kinase